MANAPFQKPTVNGDLDTWGTKLNENWDLMQIWDTTLQNTLGYDYKNTPKITGVISMLADKLLLDLDNEVFTFTGSISSPMINGTITGNAVSSNGTDYTLVKYGLNGRITTGVDGVYTDKITSSGTLNLGDSAIINSLEITGEVTGNAVSSNGTLDTLVKYGVGGLITTGSAGISTNTINNAGTLTIDGEIIGTSVSNSSSANKVVKYDVNGDINSTNINTNQINLISGTELTINSNTNVVGSFTVNGDAVENNILKENITMQVGYDKEYTNLDYALEEASNYFVGYQHFNPNNQYRITIQIDDGYDTGTWGIIKDLYLPHVDIVCLGEISIMDAYTSQYATFKGCTFGSINMSFTGGAQLPSFLTFIDCKIDNLTVSFAGGTGDRSYIYNTNINTLHAPNIRTHIYSSTIYNCTGIQPVIISTSNINIDNATSTTGAFTIVSSIVKITDSSISTASLIITNSSVYIKNSTISSSSNGLVLYSSNVKVIGGEISGDTSFLIAYDNSNISISDGCSLTSNSNSGSGVAIRAFTGSKITIVTDSSLFNQATPISPYARGLFCSNAEIMLESSDSLSILDNGTDPSIFVQYGGKISLVNVTGTTNITVNTLTSNGIIFSN